MGGNAFKSLNCPRILPDVYTEVKAITIAALRTVFTYVTVPFEIPDKADYGDIDFLVSAPSGDTTDFTLTTFPFQNVIETIKHALKTPHGRRGFLTPDCLYFAIRMPTSSSASCLEDDSDGGEEQESWVQVDVKICFKPEMFSWMTFELNFASQSSILGSMIKPLGLTLDPEGLHVRVQEMDGTNWPESMVWVTRDPWMVCMMLGLGRRAVDGGFESSEEIYGEHAGSWLFHPEHFKAKLENESYLTQHSHRSYFLKHWVPGRFPDYRLHATQDEDLQSWTERTRAAVREKVFTLFPHVAVQYYTKRSKHINEVEECRLRDLITAAIPTGTDGWRDDCELPSIIIRQPAPQEVLSVRTALMYHGELTPPPSPTQSLADRAIPSAQAESCSNPHSKPVYIDALPRQPPHPCKPFPPPQTMSIAARLACLSRWTAFSTTGTPYLLPSPHPKDFDLQWHDAIESGYCEDRLAAWAEEMWWVVWTRQCVVNWRGMWARRFEKGDAKAEKRMKEEEERAERERAEEEVRFKAEEQARSDREKILKRLGALNRALGLVEALK